MRENQQMIKLFVVLLLGTAFIFSFSHFGANAFEGTTSSDGTFSSGTTIGSLDVSGKTEDEAISLLEEKYLVWAKETSFTLEYQEKSAPIEIGQFQLDPKQTVSSIKDGIENPAFITIDQNKVKSQLEILFPEIKSSEFNLDKLTSSLNQTAAKFESGTFSYNLVANFLSTGTPKQEKLSNSKIALKTIPKDLVQMVEENSTITIDSNASFSLLDFIKEKKINMDSESLSILATGIYQAILPTNFALTEKNISNSLPYYASAGFEAKVNKDSNTDFIFTNPNKSTFTFHLKIENNRLIVTLTGAKFLYHYKFVKLDDQKLIPKTVIQYSPLVPSGKVNVQSEGANGEIVKVYREIYQGNQLIKRDQVTEDYYPPVYKVEIHPLENSTAETMNAVQNSSPDSEASLNDGQSDSNKNQQDPNNIDLLGKSNEQP